METIAITWCFLHLHYIIIYLLEQQCILALYCLCYLLRDVGVKADHQQIIAFIPVLYI